MKRVKKLLIVSLSLMMVLSGCSAGGTSKQAGSTSKKDSSGKYSPEITIKIAKQLEEMAGKYKKGETLNNNVLTKWGEKKLGIKIKTTLLGGDAGNYNTKLRLALTGSDDLPDVFPVYDKQLMSDLIESGRVKAIDGDIKKYMPQRLKEIYDKYPDSFNPVTKDGKVYGLAITPSEGIGQTMLIRQDWLDKLGLKAPTTVDEFEKVLDAFTNKDPDGNGKKDTYGWALSGKDGYSTGWISDPVFIFGAFSGKNIPGQWNKDTSGNLVYGSTVAGNKQALAKLQKWYKAGYLNRELAVQGAWDAITPFIQGKAGILFGRNWVYDSVKDVETNNPKAKVAVYKFPKGLNGQSGQSVQLYDGVLMFNSKFNNMEAFFDYYNALYDYAFSTGDFKDGFFKDYDYDVVNGKVTYDPTKFDPPLKEVQGVGKMSVLKNSPDITDAGKDYYEIYKGATPARGRQARVAASDAIVLKAGALAYEDRKYNSMDEFTGAPTKTMQKNWEQLKTLEVETFNKIVYGKKDISAFDVFVKEWKQKGGDQITKEVNDWYKSVKSK
ncbi:extracellular solute-binding protein [Clostridium oryzae]|uniref:Lipoprotein LipO n=1 Tax=Clostridium oryzae TaxID=1450648 RepID=A0A1V4IMX8_9CLOT|nr:extracellular solute-binding protein [Clostridium oryzae]OPJ61184.1 lipoprotein LipO precursor [Clostridium oryzae]